MADIQRLQEELTRLGLWNAQGPDGRYRYRYRLIPGRFELTDVMGEQLQDIARFVGYGLTRMTCAIANIEAERQERGKLPPRTAAFMRALRSSCGGYGYYPDASTVPPIVKVDLMWDGTTLKIAEIDAYNPRGMAYGVWLREAHVLAGEKGMEHHDLLQALATHTKSGGALVWLYSDRERYYQPVIQAAASILSKYDIPMRVIGEREVTDFSREDGSPLLSERDRVVIVPDRMHQNVRFRDDLVDFMLKYPDRLVMPMAPHLGSKALLAALGATFPDELGVLDFAQQSEFRSLAARYMPRTYLLGKRFREVSEWMNGTRYAVKTLAGSGAKGIYLPDDPGYAAQTAAAMRQNHTGAVAQEYVAQVPVALEGTGGLEEHFIRLTAYVEPSPAGGRILDAEVTGTGLDPLVHGGPDCVQLPVFFPR